MKTVRIFLENVGESSEGPFRHYDLETEGTNLDELVDNAVIWEVDEDGEVYEGDSISNYGVGTYKRCVAAIRDAYDGVNNPVQGG